MFIFSPTIRWQDIVDIALNSYILFRLYILFRGTKVFRMLIGILLLWFSQEAAFSLRFTVTSLVLQTITAVSALIIIVVFSNEIRSVFHAKNLKAILWGFPKKTVHPPIEIIADSIYEMAQKYCGALIVFPGKDDLKDVIQNGTVWDGKVSKEMILSIFWYGNPVHDGAAVIQGDRVTEVGVILPLSKKNLPSSYGTRHRAAKGLTELTDALVVIVSEERGSVLAAKGSRLSVMDDKAELEKELREHEGIRVTDGQGGVTRESLEYCTAALFSVLFILGVWFGVTGGLNTLVTLEIPIEYMNRDPGMEILSTSINSVYVRLSGSDILMKSVRPEQVRVKVDMTHAAVGYNVFPIRKENISLPPGILLAKVEPETVEMEVEAAVRLDVPVEYKDLDPALEILSISPRGVTLHLSGVEDTAKSVQPGQIHLTADLKKAVPGSNVISLTAGDIQLPSGIILRKIEPERAEIKIGSLIVKDLPVQADWTGKLREDLILTQVKIYPETVRMIGKPGIMENLATLYSVKIPLEPVRESGKLEVNLSFDHEVMKIAPGSKDKVTVEYRIKVRGEG